MYAHVYIYIRIYTYICMYEYELVYSKSIFRMWHHSPPEKVFSLHLLQVVVETKVSELPNVLKLWSAVTKAMLPVEYLCSNKSSFLSYSNFMQIARLSQSCDKSGQSGFLI